LSFLWQKWARLESYFGDADAVRRAARFRDEEYRNLQRDFDVDEEAVLQTPIDFGLSTSIREAEESFRFLHLVPRSSQFASASPAAAKATQVQDQSVADAEEEQSRLGTTPALGHSAHVSRPDTSKMLAFRPALDVVGGRKRSSAEQPPAQETQRGKEEGQLPVMVPKCLQDLLAVLPSRPLKGAKPDVDYLLTVLQTVSIPPVAVKELEGFRYDSLRLLNLVKMAEMVKLTTMDGETLEVEKEIACKSVLVRGIVDDSGVDEEIPLPAIKRNILEKIIEYCQYIHKNTPPEIEKPLRSNQLSDVVSEWYANFVNIEQEVLFELILAANFMDIKSLLELACAKVASLIKGMSIPEIRDFFNIENDFTPEEEAQIMDENRWAEESF